MELKGRNPLWIFTALKEFTDGIPGILESLDCKNTKDFTTLRGLEFLITSVRNVCQYILDGSPVLRELNIEQRTFYQERLTSYMESLKQYVEASQLILSQNDKLFIDGIFKCLKVSGFIYHPQKQFRMLMTIFRLRRNLVSEKMGELFEILNEWKMDNWTTEPFRTALVDQLEIFVSENSPMLDSYGEIETGEDNKLLVKMVLAIAVQSLLAKESDNVDLALNKAKFYRYLSYFNTKDIDLLLDQSIKCILGDEIKNEFTWADTNNNPGILIEKATNAARQHKSEKNVYNKKIYTSEDAEIELTDTCISVRAKDLGDEYSVLPNNIMDWMHPQILLEETVTTPSINKTRLVRNYEPMWTEIENFIFRDEDVSHQDEIVRMRPVAGFKVKARIDGAEKTSAGVLRFHCVIVDENLEGDGWLNASESTLLPWLSGKDVPAYFNLNADFNHSEDGSDLIFNMTVREAGSELKFSMKEEIFQYLNDLPQFGEECNAFVTHNDPLQTHLLCVSERGYTLKIKSDESNRGLTPGQVVRVKFLERDELGSKLYMIGEIIDDNPVYPSSIKKTIPFTNIMRGIGTSMPEDDNTVVEVSEMLSRDDVQELILMYWRCAYVEKEPVKAYNYLSFAALLARIIGDDRKRSDILCHRRLLVIKEDLSRNSRISLEDIKEFDSLTGNNIMLRKIYNRLKIVSCLDDPEQNDDLWASLQTSVSDIDRQLISNVMAYNLMAEMSDGSGSLRADIMKRITSLLNVNSIQQQLKYYGNESHKVEFKTSLVFKADRKNVKNLHEYNPSDQEHEILKVICGLINAEGGVLYIGVHDSGYEKGLADDLEYYKNYGYPTNKTLRPTIDNMAVYLTNLIKNKISGFETNGGRVEIDPEAKKDVLKVTVYSSPTPVSLDNEYFVRSGSSTFHLHGEKLEEFCRNRDANYQAFLRRNREIEDATLEQDTSEEEILEDEKTLTETPIPYVIETDNMDDNEDSYKIRTGLHRNNELHDCDPDFITPLIYLSILDGNKWKVTTTDHWDDSRITLNIHDSERDGFVVVTYIDGSINLIPVATFVNSDIDNMTYNPELENIIRMDIASKNDYIVNIIQIKNDTYCYKATLVEEFPVVDTFTHDGKQIYNQLHKIVAQEIVEPSKRSFIIETKTFKDSQPGVILQPIDGSESVEMMIERNLRPFALVK